MKAPMKKGNLLVLATYGMVSIAQRFVEDKKDSEQYLPANG